MKLSNAEMQEIDTILEKYCNTKEALSMKKTLRTWGRCKVPRCRCFSS